MFNIYIKSCIIYIGLYIICLCIYIILERKRKGYYLYEAYTNFQGKNVPTFHILIATGGRPSLRGMLDSLKSELSENDAITVIFDGPEAKKKSNYDESWLEGHQAKINTIEQQPNLGFWGHPVLNKYIPLLETETTYIMFADDDDEYIGGSFNILRNKCNDPDTLYISKMKYDENHKLYPKIIPKEDTRSFSEGNIGKPNGIIPFKDAYKSLFTNHYLGDYDYYKNLKDKVKNIVFLDDIIYTVVR